jgi:plastocyanin
MSRPRTHRLLPVKLLSSVLLGLAMLGATAAGGLAAEPAIEVTGNSLATYAWSPSTAEIDSGGSVAFKNTTANLHGLTWESGPETPSCTGTSSVGKANWAGSCTFAQGGTYKFYCPVHPAQMKGTVTVSGPAAPVVSTGSAGAVSETEATLNGTVNPSEQATTYRFEYGTTTAYGQKTTEESAGSGSSPVDKSAPVSGLAPSTTYHFRLVAKNATGTSFGLDRTFTTIGPPSATTGSATLVTDASARLNGSFNPGGFQATYFFEYGTTTAYGSKTGPGSAGNGTSVASVSMAVAGLSPETTYHFQLVAENIAGTAFGGDQTFTTATEPPLESPPSIIPPAAGPAPVPPIAPSSPPATRITLKPSAKTKDRTPTFKFTASAAGASFQCSVDKTPFKACHSPYRTPALKPGRHTFKVAAVANGLADPTPATASFKIVAKKK